MNTVGEGPNLKITEMFAFVAKDENGEGVVGIRASDGTWMPLVGADHARIESLRPIAREIAEASGKEVILLRFINRVDMGRA